MAALKKLRHKFVQLCSEHGNRAKPPVLAFERWLGRAALRQTTGDDPILPSDWLDGRGKLVVDPGLIKDIARTLPSWEAATKVATELTHEASKQVRSLSPLQEDHAALDPRALRKKLRDQGRAVREATKRATAILETLGKESGDEEENTLDDVSRKALRGALFSLQTATSALNESALRAQAAVAAGCPEDDGDGNGRVVFNGARREGVYDVMLCGPGGKPRRPYLTISSLHLSKLLLLWRLHNNNESGDTQALSENDGHPIATMNALSDENRVLFQRSLYCLLARYEALKGAGYQCALPGMAFDAAADCGLGTTVECFASPLNCRYERFCSAFPDIERRFGSLGSFFDGSSFDPFEGSFEANPPFVPETMIAMGKKLERLLADPGRGPLSFLVVVPAWGAGVDFIEKLEASDHLRASCRVEASNHAFCDGAQHTKPILSSTKPKHNNRCDASDPDLRPSSWDTAVLLLQNDAGAQKWKVDGAKLEESFCKALRASIEKVPDQFATLGAWEHRGIGQGGSQQRDTNGKRYPNNNNNRRSFGADDKTRNHSRKRPKR